MAVDLNPKAVTNDELFGIINPATREWKDGLFSTIMRDLANLTSDGKDKISKKIFIKKLDKIYLLFL
jgi:hypothetical protein